MRYFIEKICINRCVLRRLFIYLVGFITYSLLRALSLHITGSDIGAGSRKAAAPLEIFWPLPWATFASLRLVS